MEQEVFEADRLSRRSFARLLRSPSAALLVAESGDGLSGYCAVLFRAKSRCARLYSIAVAAGHRGTGIGTRLLEAAESVAASRAFESLRLEVRRDNAAAIHSYEQSGFRAVGTAPAYYADGCDALRYEKVVAGGTSADRTRARKGPAPSDVAEKLISR